MNRTPIRSWARTLALVALMVMLLAALPAEAQPPTPIPQADLARVQVAFADHDGEPLELMYNNNIHLSSLDGEVEIFFDRPGYETYAAWSPDGQLIAYSGAQYDLSTYQLNKFAIYVMNVDGSNVVQLTDHIDAKYPAWSPDGEWIVFQAQREEQEDLYMVHVADQTLVQITDTEDQTEVSPDWSPDGSALVYVGGAMAIDIWHEYLAILDLTTLEETRLIELNERDEAFTIIDQPHFSPDGSQILFSTRGAIHLFNLEDNTIQHLSELNGLAVYPSWSSDGTQIWFSSFAPPPPGADYMFKGIGCMTLATREVVHLPVNTGAYPRVRPGALTCGG